jgi:uncharacterized YceG family protein
VTDHGGPRRGRHSPSDPAAGSAPWAPGGAGAPGGPLRPGLPELPVYGAPRYEAGRYDPPTWVSDAPEPPLDRADSSTAGLRRHSRLLDRSSDATGPLVSAGGWAHGSSDHPDHPLSSRHGREDLPGRPSWASGDEDAGSQHPSAPLPPRPPGVWDRLHQRRDDGHGPQDDDAPTVAQPLLPPSPAGVDRGSERDDDTDDVATQDHDVHDVDVDADPTDGRHRQSEPDDSRIWEDETGGLDVIGAHVQEDEPRRRGRRARRAAARHDDPPSLLVDRDDEPDAVHDEASGEDIPVTPYDPRTARSRGRRRPVAVLLTLVLLAGVVAGIVLGGQRLLALIDPTARDYTGQGTGTVQIRVQDGDTLSDIARTLVSADVIASTGPFVDAAESNAASVGIQPGLYGMRQQMSGQAALDLLLDPATRLLSRVTLPEGLTVERTLAKVAEETGRPLSEFEAAADDPAALGLPVYANGLLEGFLFPATYDFEPDDAPVDMLRAMVTRSQQAFGELRIAEADRLTVLTKASLVQAEASSAEDMAKVARVLENRLADGMALQLDTTVNYANGKGGITTTASDRANPSLYNTYVHPGLPPGAINNPGEDALRAVLDPAPGDWRFFVVVDPDTGDTRFAVTKEEHDQNVLLFRQWLRANPEG